METEGCYFPDELEYTNDMNLWLRKEKSGRYRIGMTSALLWTAGKPVKVLMKEKGTAVAEGKSVGSVEGRKFFDTLRVPFGCTIEEVNTNIDEGSRLSTASIYGEHWLAVVEVTTEAGISEFIVSGREVRERAIEKVRSLRLHCFSELPDAEMVEIGSECSAVMARLSQLMENRDEGFAVHLVTDDVTAPIEMVRWSDETGNRLAETRKTDNVYHFIAVKK